MIFYTLIASGNNYIFMQLLMRTLRAKLFLFLQFSTLEHLHEGDVALGITGGFADRVHSAKVVAKVWFPILSSLGRCKLLTFNAVFVFNIALAVFMG
jgi:hypothetical protein